MGVTNEIFFCIIFSNSFYLFFKKSVISLEKNKKTKKEEIEN